MPKIQENMKAFIIRRKILLSAGSATVAALTGAAFALNRQKNAILANSFADAKITDLGDGFFLVDGWVFHETDLNQRNLKANK